MKPSERLAELTVSLPPVAPPAGSYVPAVLSGSFVFTSGQLPFRDGKLARTGKVPADVSLEEAADDAGTAVLNALAAAAQTAGGLDAIKRIVRLTVFVNSSPGFTDQPKVANGASDLLTKIFAEAGKHARAAIGAAELPLGAPVEVELMVELA